MNTTTHALDGLNPLVANLAAGIDDPRILLAVGLCQDQIREPPLGLGQIRRAIGIVRPQGAPCERTIQRWVDEKGMPCALDPAANQRVYFFSKCLAWYQQTFHFIPTSEIAESDARDLIIKDLQTVATRAKRKAN